MKFEMLNVHRQKLSQPHIVNVSTQFQDFETFYHWNMKTPESHYSCNCRNLCTDDGATGANSSLHNSLRLR
jgi:hypothetical protein